MDDAISRQAVLKLLSTMPQEEAMTKALLIQSVKQMDAAQPERKRGRWNCSDDMYESAVCSVCGWDTTEPWDHIRHWFNYCPKCGVNMREVSK